MGKHTFIFLTFAISALLYSCEKAELPSTSDTGEKHQPVAPPDSTVFPQGVRNGSEEHPFLASDLATGSVGLYILANETEKTNSWVTGYIVGYVNGTSIKHTEFDTGDVASNIVIADSPYETQIEAVVPIQLSTGTTYARVRQALNIKDNPQRLYSKVAVFGKICPYMNVAGMKNTRDYKLLE
ncbi:MAG: hypothetical protein KBS99_03045 [Prevotellaceae bacterium]|nr:hypothetical protein [Candidatus Colivivens caballi]